MTNKERVHASLEGKPVDRYPVTALYSQLIYMDHFAELTGEPQWKLHAWMNAEPEEHMRLYKRMIDLVPFEILQPISAPPHEQRTRVEFIEKDGKPFRCDRKTGERFPLEKATVSGHANDYTANEDRVVFDSNDVKEHVKVTKAKDMIASGSNDYIEATVAEFGKERFILSGGVVGTAFCCSRYVGLTNLYAMMAEEPDLLDVLSKKILEQNIEQIRRLAAAGGDAIFIDDATTTCDMISVEHYERFSLPYMKAMVEKIHNLGHKAILIYFGGIADRLEQIASINADGLSMEASMKGYVNDIGKTVRAIGDRITMFSNIDPIGIIQDASDAELKAEIERQKEAGARGRGFVLSPASPITPATPIQRVQKYIELCKEIR